MTLGHFTWSDAARFPVVLFDLFWFCFLGALVAARLEPRTAFISVSQLATGEANANVTPWKYASSTKIKPIKAVETTFTPH